MYSDYASYPCLLGRWTTDEHKVLFPESNKNFPYKIAESYVEITKQEGYNLWGKSYWRYVDSEDKMWNEEILTGIVSYDGTIRFNEVGTNEGKLVIGYITLRPISTNLYEFNFTSIERGVTFRTNCYHYQY